MKISRKQYNEIMGTPGKLLQKGEEKYRASFRKGLYAADNIMKGDYIGRTDIISMRPCLEGARPSEEYEDVLMKPAKKDFKQYEAL